MMRALRRTIAAVAVCAIAVTSAAGAGLQTGLTQTGAAQAPDLQGKLYKSVFSTGVGALKYEDLPTAPEALRDRLARYLSRRAAFKSGYKSGADSFEAVRVEAKRRMIEQAIVALIEVPGSSGWPPNTWRPRRFITNGRACTTARWKSRRTPRRCSRRSRPRRSHPGSTSS